ncbi:MAG: hypothetical protein HY568_02560 [Candidatus Latescibacteria bacterium]|nr:hypothetical protein [Candidatus Latescibacterota bacterium]
MRVLPHVMRVLPHVMRVPVRAAILSLAILCGAGVSGSASASLTTGDGPASAEARGAPEPRYTLELGPGLDSLSATARAAFPGSTARPDAPLRTLAELRGFAALVRERLLALGATDAVVRLTIVRGSGSEIDLPGMARISVERRGAPPRAVAVVSGGLDVLPDAASRFDLASGGIADPAHIHRGLTALRAASQARGRYGARAAIDSIVSEGGLARVHVTLVPGPEVTLDTLDLKGSGVRAEVSGAISGLKKGRLLTPEALENARLRLESSDLFASVGALEVMPGPAGGNARVTAPVVPNRVSRFEGAVGVQNGGGLTGIVDLALGNIAGSGRSADARWAGFGRGRFDYAVRYREPALFGRGLGASVALEAQVADSLFTQTRWSLEISGRPSARARASAALKRSGSVYTGAARGLSSTWSMEGRLSRQGLSPPANPERGLDARLALEAGKRTEVYPGYDRASRSLLRGEVALQAARPAGRGRAVYASIRGERVALGEGAVPAEELRFVGGNEGLRGHRDRAYAGSRILAMSFEHRWLTDARGGRAFLFLDAVRHDLDAEVEAGTLRRAPELSLARTELSPGWEFGYGAGIRSPIPSGAVGIELGMKPGAPLREGKLHLHFATNW